MLVGSLSSVVERVDLVFPLPGSLLLNRSISHLSRNYILIFTNYQRSLISLGLELRCILLFVSAA